MHHGRMFAQVFASLIAVSLAAVPSLARPLDEVKAAKSLRVVAYLDNEPFSWDQNGSPTGIDVDIARAIARELGVGADIILRMQGEKADDDLRANVWKGPLTGGGVGDIMMHVPVDREFAMRNTEAMVGNPYFQEQVVLAIHPELTGDHPNFDVFKKQTIGVQLGTVADYFLMTYQDGALIENVTHHTDPKVGVKQFKAKEVAALLGVRSNIEALLHDFGVKPVLVEPPMIGIVRSSWIVGMGWKENSHDLGYAIQTAMDKIKSSGEMKRIFDTYGVTYIEPPVDDQGTAPN